MYIVFTDKRTGKVISGRKRMLSIFLIIVCISIGAILLRPYVLDLIFIINNKYSVAESDLSRYRKEYIKGGRGYTTQYKLYTYDIEKDIRKRKTDDIYMNPYKYVDLNIYQYKDLENLYLQESINGLNYKRIKLYYLPNTNIVLKYELLD